MTNGAGVCSGILGAVLYTNNCTIVFTLTVNAYYAAVTVQIEDYYSSSSTTPMSSVPLEFLFYGYITPVDCSAQPSIIGVRPNRAYIGTPIGTNVTEYVIAQVGCTGKTIIDFTSSSPVGMTKRIYQIVLSWIPVADQYGPQVPKSVGCPTHNGTYIHFTDSTSNTLVQSYDCGSAPEITYTGFTVVIRFPIAPWTIGHSYYVTFDSGPESAPIASSLFWVFNIWDPSLSSTTTTRTTPPTTGTVTTRGLSTSTVNTLLTTTGIIITVLFNTFEREKITSSAEYLPRELWLHIFIYLEGHDIVRSFSCLNSLFASLLRSSHLQLFICIKQNESNEKLPQSTWSHINLENIYSITVRQRKANCLIRFLRWHAQHLVRLQSLCLYLRKSVGTIDNFQLLTADIFSERFIAQKCSFIFEMSDANMTPSDWSINRMIKQLYIHSITSTELFSLLSFTPQLYSLETTMKLSQEISNQNVALPHLEKLNLHLAHTYFLQLEMLKELAPNSRSLRVKGYFNTDDDNYFNENMWHKLFKNINYFDVDLHMLARLNSKMVNLKNRIRLCEEKSWFHCEETNVLLRGTITFKSMKT
ncbi:unnamed protein product [Rotaria magnacalcarata]